MIRGAIHALEKAIEGSYQLPGSFSWLQSSAPMFSLKGDQVSFEEILGYHYIRFGESCLAGVPTG